MALKRDTRYPGRFTAGNAAHPQGAFKNRTAPDAKDGSYLEQDWANDWDGFFARLLTVAGVTANGNVDSGTSSQYYDALIASVKANLGTAALRNVGTGSNQIPDMSSFTKGNGWVRFPNGTIIQRGTLDINANTINVNVSLPVPFTSSDYTVLATITASDPAPSRPVGGTPFSLSALRLSNWSATLAKTSWIAIGE